jgi:hypothetical protein
MQSLHTVAPASENLPNIQSVQISADGAPIIIENLPAMHGWQLDAVFKEYVPAAQFMHSVVP